MGIKNKIDFSIVISVDFCNPNGDPINGNRPRIDLDGYGYMSDVCLKRKIRNRFQDFGENVLILPNDRVSDGLFSVKDRVSAQKGLMKHEKDRRSDLFKEEACKTWIDVRTFGQVFAFKGKNEVSISVRGPVSIGLAKSLRVVDLVDMTIRKCTNNETPKSGNVLDMDSTTIGVRHVVRSGAYVAYGSIFPQLAELTGFSEKDKELLKEALSTLFENDATASRPSGSMSSTLYWWEHVSSKGKNANSINIFRSLNIESEDEWPYFSCHPKEIPGVELTVI